MPRFKRLTLEGARAQSIVGAAIMLRDSGEHPVILREAITSVPRGRTILRDRRAGAPQGTCRVP